MVARLATEAGTKLTLSHLMRPYFDLLLHCEDQLSEELRRADVSRPVNDKTALAYLRAATRRGHPQCAEEGPPAPLRASGRGRVRLSRPYGPNVMAMTFGP